MHLKKKMSIFGFNECAAVAAWGTFFSYQLITYPFHKRVKEYIEGMGGTVAAWVLLLVVVPIWLLEVALLTITAFYFTQNTPADSWQLILGFVLYLLYGLFIKFRYWSFYKSKNTNLTMGLSVILVLLGGAFYVPLTVDNTQRLWLVPLLTHTAQFAGVLGSFLTLAFGKYMYNGKAVSMKQRV